MKRRKFLKSAAASALLPSTLISLESAVSSPLGPRLSPPTSHTVPLATGLPVAACTWDYGRLVPETAYGILRKGGSPLDAVEAAVRIPEADPAVTSVGIGGYPDRDGKVTLDACVMEGGGRCGSVVFLEHIAHPVSVARGVMEKTDHVMLAGSGALQFALANGFTKQNFLSPQAAREYKAYLKESGYKPTGLGRDNHDTIGMLALSEAGKMAGACSTSGLKWKMRGRVGDSPLIGAGLYVDDEVGGATATGLGETVIRVCGSFLIVELMRGGKSPQEACRLAVERLIRKQPQYREADNFLVGFLAMNILGEVGGCSYRKGFQYSTFRDGVFTVTDAEYLA